jgi:branched-chain amino acid transport system permease protein
MLFLGGIGTIYGPILGAFFMKLLPELTYQIHDYELLLDGLILIVVLVFMPTGLFGICTSLRDRLFAKADK